jgi:hypothetical protein
VRETLEHAQRVMADGHEARELFEDADQQLLATIAESRRLRDL